MPGDEMNRAEVPATYELRMLVSYAAMKGWRLGALDIKSAFLHADLEESDGVIVVEPPRALAKYGVIREGTLWKLNKVLYGLRAGPKKWSEYRDRVISTMTINDDVELGGVEGEPVVIEQCTTTSNLWMVRRRRSSELLACFMVYVDDVMIAGEMRWVEKIIAQFTLEWDCKISGVLKQHGEKHNEKVGKHQELMAKEKLNFLGMTLESSVPGFIQIHQKDYILAKLDKRQMLSGRYTKGSLPMVKEGMEPEDRSTAEYIESVPQAQAEVGTLQWLAIKTRPDIAAITSILASLITRCPSEVVRVVGGVWKYLAATWNVTLNYKMMGSGQIGDSQLTANQKEMKLTTLTDASFAPGGDRSRSGYCVYFGPHLIHWGSTKQQVTAMSSCEAELDAAIVGLKHSRGIFEVLTEIDERMNIIAELMVDNAAALKSMKYVATNWRNRHFAIRASWIRDAIEDWKVETKYKPGKDLEADALTKILDRVKLEEMRKKLGLEALGPETE